uniref:hypothetical protein n=1 Tax=Agathobacter sp. TaxID=2021311 RepID=UPI004056C4F0
MYDFSVTDMLTKRIMKETPIFKQSNFSFCREENGGYISVRSSNVPRLQELFLNRTSQNILRECNGYNKVEQIIKNISDLYPSIQRQIIANDVITNLSILTRYQLIEWKGRNPFMKILSITLEGDKRFELLDEGDIRELIVFIKKNNQSVKFLNIMSRLEPYYDELFLRDVLFNFTEDFFAVRENGEIKGIITLKYNTNVNSTVCSLGIMIVSKEYEDSLLSGIVTYSGNTCNRQITKIKVQILERDCETKANLIKKLQTYGFEKENISLKEFQGENICNYSFFYESEDSEGC